MIFIWDMNFISGGRIFFFYTRSNLKGIAFTNSFKSFIQLSVSTFPQAENNLIKSVKVLR